MTQALRAALPSLKKTARLYRPFACNRSLFTWLLLGSRYESGRVLLRVADSDYAHGLKWRVQASRLWTITRQFGRLVWSDTEWDAAICIIVINTTSMK